MNPSPSTPIRAPAKRRIRRNRFVARLVACRRRPGPLRASYAEEAGANGMYQFPQLQAPVAPAWRRWPEPFDGWLSRRSSKPPAAFNPPG